MKYTNYGFRSKRAAGFLRAAFADGRDVFQNVQNLRGQRAVFKVQNFLRLRTRIRNALRRIRQQLRKRRVIFDEYGSVS